MDSRVELLSVDVPERRLSLSVIRETLSKRKSPPSASLTSTKDCTSSSPGSWLTSPGYLVQPRQLLPSPH